MTKFSGYFALVIASFIQVASSATFQNPINPSADPWMGYAEGQYHLTTTVGNRVQLWSARSIEKLKDAKPVTIWERGKGVWAAEFHELPGPNGTRWYCYFTKTDGEDIDHRMFVMESKTKSIKGPYGEPRQILTDPKDEYYAIDGSVFEHKGKYYFMWAGHPGHLIYISRMKDPFTLEGKREMIPADGLGCGSIREGPYIIKHGSRLFLTYSTCHTELPDYKVGYLWMSENRNPMRPNSWTQHPEPLLARNDAAEVYGPGHHSFFKSPDGTEDWIAYHAKTTSAITTQGRSSRIQKLEWDEKGFPKPVVPLPLDVDIKVPSARRR